MLRALRWLMLLMLILLVFLLGMFFKMADCEAAVVKQNNLTEAVERIKESTLDNQKYAQDIVETSKNNHLLIEPTNHKSLVGADLDVIGQILTSYDQIKQSSCPENKKDGLRIFVSFSMPKALLEQYNVISKRIGAKLVMRGFKNNSFKETIQYTQKIAIEVDPVAFKKFAITSVPSFVLSSSDKFDKLVGNISINYALTKFKDEGDLKEKAQEYLMRLNSHESR